jgi:hypothetical protein
LIYLKAGARRPGEPHFKTELTMAEGNAGRSGFPGFEPIMNAMAEWTRLCRVAFGGRDDLVQSIRIESVRAANALAAQTAALIQSVPGWPQAAILLRRMLIALGIDPDSPALRDHAAIAELQRSCAACDRKLECAQDLSNGTAAENFYAYCPNAKALDSIYVEMTFNTL